MGDDHKPDALKNLDARLRAARAEQHSHEPDHTRAENSQAQGWAWRVAIEMVVAVAFGGGLGWLLDYWLGTLPIFLILFFLLGAGAGIRNVYRAAQAINRAAWDEDTGKDADQASSDGTDSTRGGTT
jgi:ATP synthase protein I